MDAIYLRKSRDERFQEFIEKATAVHGDKYDYSLVEYRTCKDKVKIICPIHGVFEQTPEHHAGGCGCPKCRPDRIRATVRSRYGVDFISQSVGFQEAVERTNLRKYGVRRPLQNSEIHKKAVETSRLRYGTDYPMQNSEIVEKFRQAFLEKYGIEHPSLSKELHKRSILSKITAGTATGSVLEDTIYTALCFMFGKNFVCRQYFDSVRYPFFCDFYVTSMDLFIELNAYWSHGRHWFDPTDENDVRTLSLWREKARKGRKHYESSIAIWTVSDPAKKAAAVLNNLNYVVFWKKDLSDFWCWAENFANSHILKQF